MPVYKDNKTNTWRAVFRYTDWTGEKKQTQKRGFITQKAAKAWEKEEMLKLQGACNMTFDSFVELYFESLSGKLKLNTINTKRHIFETKILPYFADKKINEIKATDVINWQNKLIKAKDENGKPFSQTYLKTIHNQMSAILNFAVKYYGLKENVARKAGAMGKKESDREMLIWTKDEYIRFAEAKMEEPMHYYAFELLYWCGIREGELLALTPSDFDFNKRTLRINKSYQRINGCDIITEPKTPKSNPDKTIYSDLKNAIHYAENGEKTISEEACFVTGVNCNTDTAYEEMKKIQVHFGKISGNVAYHAYQSFKTGEVTPKQCHRLGVELAKQMWGTDYQVLVATHFNTGTYHNHFVINSVNMWNGKKFNCNKKAYYKFRDLSDSLCEREHLTVLANPQNKISRTLYYAEKNGEPTKYNLMREAIDKSLSISCSPKEFIYVLKKQGYIINLNPGLKYATIRFVNDTRNTRLYRLGEKYDKEHIFQTLKENDFWKTAPEFNTFQKSIKPKYVVSKKVRFNGYFATTRKITGLKALYLHYCYLLGYLPKAKQHKPLSPEMRAAWRRIDRYSQEIQLIDSKELTTISVVNEFISTTKEQIVSLEKQRQHCYNKMRRCKQPSVMAELKSKRDDFTKTLTLLRKEVKVATNILEDNDEIKRNMKAEKAMQQKRFITKQKTRHRYDDLCR